MRKNHRTIKPLSQEGTEDMEILFRDFSVPSATSCKTALGSIRYLCDP